MIQFEQVLILSVSRDIFSRNNEQTNVLAFVKIKIHFRCQNPVVLLLLLYHYFKPLQ